LTITARKVADAKAAAKEEKLRTKASKKAKPTLSESFEPLRSKVDE